METTRGCRGIYRVILGSIGIMEKKMQTTGIIGVCFLGPYSRRYSILGSIFVKDNRALPALMTAKIEDHKLLQVLPPASGLLLVISHNA